MAEMVLFLLLAEHKEKLVLHQMHQKGLKELRGVKRETKQNSASQILFLLFPSFFFHLLVRI